MDSATSSPTWLPAEGTLIGGRYRLGRLLGVGGMGAVVQAEHVSLGESVALKFLKPDANVEAEAIARFVREAKASSRIKSEHVIRVLDVGASDQGLSYIAMEFLEGQDLGHLVDHGVLPIPLAIDCILQASEALAEAHAAGIVHRDIKPANLWLSTRRDGSPLLKILDFGISKVLPQAGAGADTRLTETQSVFGSPSYMSPEQVRSAKRVDHRTDVWALGVVLFELLTKTLPFPADTVSGVFAAIIADPPQSLRTLRPEAPIEIERAILGCLDKDPARRPSLSELAASLRPFGSASGQIAADRVQGTEGPAPEVIISMPPPPAPISSAPEFALGVTERDPSQTQRSAPIRLGMVFVGLALVAGIVAFLITQRRTPSSPIVSTTPITSVEPEPAPTTPPPPPPPPVQSTPSVSAPMPARSTPPPVVAKPHPPPAVRSVASSARPTPAPPAPPPTSGLPISEDRR